MAKVILGMTTSLDGFVADQNGRVGRLYSDLAALRDNAYMNDLIEETGAVLMGKRTFEMGVPTRTSATTSSRADFRSDSSPAAGRAKAGRAPDLHFCN